MFPGQLIFLCFAVVISLLGVFVLLYEFRRKRFEPERAGTKAEIVIRSKALG